MACVRRRLSLHHLLHRLHPDHLPRRRAATLVPRPGARRPTAPRPEERRHSSGRLQYSRAEITCVRVFILFFYFIGYLLVGIFLGFQSTLHIASSTGCTSSAKCMRLLMPIPSRRHCDADAACDTGL